MLILDASNMQSVTRIQTLALPRIDKTNRGRLTTQHFLCVEPAFLAPSDTLHILNTLLGSGEKKQI